MADLQVFENEQFGQIRTIKDNGKVMFCGKDVAVALGYSNTNKALNDHCKKDGVTNRYLTDNLGREQQAKFITESNLYRLIAHSRLPEAEKFESWVFDEVLPSIAHHGAYMTTETMDKVLQDPDFGIRLLSELKSEREQRQRLEQEVEVNQPKVLFADSVSASNTSILIGELAKLIKQNGVSIGQKRLFEWLRNHGYLIKRNGTDRNMPTQRSMEMGLFEVKETVISHSDGHTSISKTAKVTGKGQVYFINKFLAN